MIREYCASILLLFCFILKTRNPLEAKKNKIRIREWMMKWLYECARCACSTDESAVSRLCIKCTHFIFIFFIVENRIRMNRKALHRLSVWRFVRRSVTANVTHLTDFLLNYVNSHRIRMLCVPLALPPLNWLLARKIQSHSHQSSNHLSI